MGTAAPAALREVSRAARTALLSDRAGPVRAAAAHALRHMLPLIRLTPADLDTIAAACLRAALQSDYTLRCGTYLIQLSKTFVFNVMFYLTWNNPSTLPRPSPLPYLHLDVPNQSVQDFCINVNNVILFYQMCSCRVTWCFDCRFTSRRSQQHQ